MSTSSSSSSSSSSTSIPSTQSATSSSSSSDPADLIDNAIAIVIQCKEITKEERMRFFSRLLNGPDTTLCKLILQCADWYRTETLRLLARRLRPPPIITCKRDSLPVASSSQTWNMSHLRYLNIEIIWASREELLNCGSVDLIPHLMPTHRSNEIIEEMNKWEPIYSTAHKLCHRSWSADDHGDGSSNKQSQPQRSGIGWTLMKYLSLTAFQSGMASATSDFFIHLLAALGYNEADLLVVSDHRLELVMNGETHTITANVGVCHYETRFQTRLIIMEHKPLVPSEYPIRVDEIESQLIAFGIAAARGNSWEDSNPYDNYNANLAGTDHTKGVGTIFLISIINGVISFYSVNPSVTFMKGFANYDQFPRVDSDSDSVAIPLTTVYQYAQVCQGASERLIRLREFYFSLADHRKWIVEIVDLIRQHITLQQ